jgi:hypothetical protein
MGGEVAGGGGGAERAASGFLLLAVVAFVVLRVPHFVETYGRPTWLDGRPVDCSGFALGAHIGASVLFMLAVCWSVGTGDRGLDTLVVPLFLLLASGWAISATPEASKRASNLAVNAALTALALIPLAWYAADEEASVRWLKALGALFVVGGVGVSLWPLLG